MKPTLPLTAAILSRQFFRPDGFEPWPALDPFLVRYYYSISNFLDIGYFVFEWTLFPASCLPLGLCLLCFLRNQWKGDNLHICDLFGEQPLKTCLKKEN